MRARGALKNTSVTSPVSSSTRTRWGALARPGGAGRWAVTVTPRVTGSPLGASAIRPFAPRAPRLGGAPRGRLGAAGRGRAMGRHGDAERRGLADRGVRDRPFELAGDAALRQ